MFDPLREFRSARSTIRAFLVLLGVGVACGCGRPQATEPPPTADRPPAAPTSVDLLALLPKATLKQPKPEHILRTRMPVAGEEREVLFMHPPSRATYPPVRMTLESRLDLSLGVSEKAWSNAGDGVQFSVYAQPSGGVEVRIFSTYIDPKHQMQDRRWIDAVVTLGTYSGQDVTLTLETDPGPAGDLGWDWAGWSKATLVLGG